MRYFVVFTLIVFVLAAVLAGLGYSDILHDAFSSICLVFAVIAIIRQFVFLCLSQLERRHRRGLSAVQFDQKDEIFPKVSIIVPAYNEERVIERALNSLLEINYPDYDVIVIDDGSVDGTFKIASQVAKQNPNKILVISQENGGKSKALNNGIRLSDSPYVLCVDADSTIQPNGIKSAVKHFIEPAICAVSGFVDVDKEQRELLPRLQRLEYLVMQCIYRAGLSRLRCIPIVPGPAGLFRRQAIIDVGGYSSNDTCFAEDAELTTKLLANGGEIIADECLVSSTQAPTDLDSLLRQRYRWFRGSLQALFQNFDNLLMKNTPRAFMLFCFLILEYLMLPVAGVSIGVFFLFDTVTVGEVSPLIWGLIVLVFLEIVGLTLIIKPKTLLPIRVLEFIAYRLSYGYLMLFWSFFCLIDEVLNSSMSWDKLERQDC